MIFFQITASQNLVKKDFRVLSLPQISVHPRKNFGNPESDFSSEAARMIQLLIPAVSALGINTAIDAGAAAGLALGPCLVPTLTTGYRAMIAKYENAPEGELFDVTRWRGEFPEYDITNAALSNSHISATLIASFFLFFGALEQARVPDVDLNDVYAMALYAFSFQGDSLTHAFLSKDGADGNIMQKGHMLDTLPMIAFFLYANYLDGGAWYALTDLPADGFWMLIPRIATHPIFLFLTFYAWQPAHGLGLFGGLSPLTVFAKKATN